MHQPLSISAQRLDINEAYVAGLFRSRTAMSGGVVRRARRDVLREMGEDRLIEEVRKRGFRLLRTRHHYLIICCSDPVELIL